MSEKTILFSDIIHVIPTPVKQ